jgi:hypothetical protein
VVASTQQVRECVLIKVWQRLQICRELVEPVLLVELVGLPIDTVDDAVVAFSKDCDDHQVRLVLIALRHHLLFEIHLVLLQPALLPTLSVVCKEVKTFLTAEGQFIRNVCPLNIVDVARLHKASVFNGAHLTQVRPVQLKKIDASRCLPTANDILFVPAEREYGVLHWQHVKHVIVFRNVKEEDCVHVGADQEFVVKDEGG